MNDSKRFEIFDRARQQPSQDFSPPFLRPFPPGYNPFDIRNYIGINQGNQGQVGENAFQGQVGENAFQGQVGQNAFQGQVGENAFQGQVGEDANEGDAGEDANEGDAGEDANEGDAGEDANEGRVKNKPTWRCPWPGCQSIKLYTKKGLNSHIAYKHKISGFTVKLKLLDSCIEFVKQAVDLKENFGIEVLNENGMDLVKKFNQHMNYLKITLK